MFIFLRHPGYVAVAYGEVYKTTDAGVNWVLKTTCSSYATQDVFNNVNTGYVGGWNNTLYKTTNGGTQLNAVV